MNFKIKIISLNVVDLNNVIKRHRTAKSIKTEKSDLVCLQETHLRSDKIKIL